MNKQIDTTDESFDNAKEAADYLGLPGAEEFLDWNDKDEVPGADDGRVAIAVAEDGRVVFATEFQFVYLVLPSLDAARRYIATGETPKENKCYAAASDVGAALMTGEDGEDDPRVGTKWVSPPWFDVDADAENAETFPYPRAA